jgi:LCP family protein required for cell wall assembly
MGSERARTHRSSFPWAQLLCAILFIGMVAGGLYLGYLAYNSIRGFASRTQFSSMPLLSTPPTQSQSEPQTEPGQTQQQGSQDQVPPQSEIRTPDVESKDRINILFMGIDQRPGESTACRTDTMILISVNPRDMSVSLLSIPRDLWVPIPGRAEDRINTAHYWGEVDDYPGGGPALAKHTVRYNFGVPVHYYVRLNFTGFERIIDAIGGIDVNVPETIYDTQYPGENYEYTTLEIPAGQHHFDGEMALKYARTRKGNGDGDFSRMKRQQQVILAVRDQVLSLPNLPHLVMQLPQLAREMGDSLDTDIPPDVMFTLAKWAQQIKSENIRADTIDRRVTTDRMTADGRQVLVYDRERARPIIEALFTDPTPDANAAGTNQVSKLEDEQARIAVYNGTMTPGLAGTIASFLSIQGIQVVQFDNADRFDYERTSLIVYGDKPFTVHWLTSWLTDLGVPEPRVELKAVESDVDIAIIIGQDFPADKIR